jgi:hypothetical protein
MSVLHAGREKQEKTKKGLSRFVVKARNPSLICRYGSHRPGYQPICLFIPILGFCQQSVEANAFCIYCSAKKVVSWTSWQAERQAAALSLILVTAQ